MMDFTLIFYVPLILPLNALLSSSIHLFCSALLFFSSVLLFSSALLRLPYNPMAAYFFAFFSGYGHTWTGCSTDKWNVKSVGEGVGLSLQNQFSEIKVSFSEVEQWNMIAFIIAVQSTDRLYAQFSIKSIKKNFPKPLSSMCLLSLGLLSGGQPATKSFFHIFNRKWDGCFFPSRSSYNFQCL